MYKFLSRSVTKSHSDTLNFTNICRKVSNTHNKSGLILKRSVSDLSIKSENALEETVEDASSEQKTDELKELCSSSTLAKNYQILKKSIFAERPRDFIQTRKFRTCSATCFLSSGINHSKKSSKSGFPNFRVADTYKKAMEQCLKIKNQKKRIDHPFINNSLQPKPVKFEAFTTELARNTAQIESNAKMTKKKQVLNKKPVFQDINRYTKSIKIDHPKQKEPFKIVYPIRKIKEKTGFSGNYFRADHKVAKKRINSTDLKSTSGIFKISQKQKKQEKVEKHLNVSPSTMLGIRNEKYATSEQEQNNQYINNAKMILSRYTVKSQGPVKGVNKLAKILLSQREREKMHLQDVPKNNEKIVVKEKQNIQDHPILVTEESKINLDPTDDYKISTTYSDQLINEKTYNWINEDTYINSKDSDSYKGNKPTKTKKLDEPVDGFEEQQITRNIEELLKRNKDKMDLSEDYACNDIKSYMKELNAFKEQSAMDKSGTKKPHEHEEKNENEINNGQIHYEPKTNQCTKATVTSKCLQRYPADLNKTVKEQSYEDAKNTNDRFKDTLRSSATSSFDIKDKNNLLENFGKNDLTPAQTFNGNKEKLQKILMQYKCENPQQTEIVNEKSKRPQTYKRTDENMIRKMNAKNESRSDSYLPALPAAPVSKYIRKIRETNIKAKKESTNNEKAVAKIRDSTISTTALLERIRQTSKPKIKLNSDIEVPEASAISFKSSVKRPRLETENLKHSVNRKVKEAQEIKIKNPVTLPLLQKVKLVEEIKIRSSNYETKKSKIESSEIGDKDSIHRSCKEDFTTRPLETDQIDSQKIVTKFVSDAKENNDILSQNNDVIPLKLYIKEYNPQATTSVSHKCANIAQVNKKSMLEDKAVENKISVKSDVDNEASNNELDHSDGFKEKSVKSERVPTQETMLADESDLIKLHKLVEQDQDFNQMKPEISSAETKSNYSRLHGRKYGSLKGKHTKRQNNGSTNGVKSHTKEQNRHNPEGHEVQIQSDKNNSLDLATPQTDSLKLKANNNNFVTEDASKDKTHFEQISNSTNTLPRKEKTGNFDKENIGSKTHTDLHLLKEASRKSRFVFKDSKMILMPKKSNLQQKNKNKNRIGRPKNYKETVGGSGAFIENSNSSKNVNDKMCDKNIVKLVIIENKKELNLKPYKKTSIEESNTDKNSEKTTTEEKLQLKHIIKSSLKSENKPKECSKVVGDFNEPKPLTTSFKTFNDSYFLNFKHGNRAHVQDVVERFQSGENTSDNIREDTNKNMRTRIDIVDHFHLVKEVANKARERLKYYNKTDLNKEDLKQKVNADLKFANTESSGENVDKTVSSSITGRKDTTNDISVDQPFIRKEIPRPPPKRDDKAKKDPPRPRASIKLPPPKNQEGTKLDDEVKPTHPPASKLESNTEDIIIVINKNTNDLQEPFLMGEEGKVRDNVQCIVAKKDELNIDYKDGSDPNLIKLALADNIENQKKSSNRKDHPNSLDSKITSKLNSLESIRRYNKNKTALQENNDKDNLKKQNESMKQEMLSQKFTVKRQPLPIHIVRKLMKIKRQRDRGKEFDRAEEYEKFFNVVINPQETTIQKPVLKSNHSDSSLMKLYLLEDDSKTESFIVKDKYRSTRGSHNPRTQTTYEITQHTNAKENKHLSEDVQKENKESEVINGKERNEVQNVSVAEQVLRSLKRTENSFKSINDAAKICKASLPTSLPLPDKKIESKENMYVTKKDDYSEQLIVDVSDIKPRKSLLLIFNEEQDTECDLKPTNLLSKATLDTNKSSNGGEETNKIKCCSIIPAQDPLNKEAFQKMCESSLKKNRRRIFNTEKKRKNVSSDQRETFKKSVVFVLKKSRPPTKSSIGEKIHVQKCEDDKNLTTTNTKGMLTIDDKPKRDLINKSVIPEKNDKNDVKTKTIQNKKINERPSVSDSAGKHKSTILKLEECFSSIVMNLKKLDERGQLVKSVASSINSMVIKCTNKCLEEILTDKQKQIVRDFKQQKFQEKQELPVKASDQQFDKTNKWQTALDSNPIQIKEIEEKQTLPQLKEMNKDEIQFKHVRVNNSKETNKDSKENYKNTTRIFGSNTDVMAVIKKGLAADDLIKKNKEHKNYTTAYMSKSLSLNEKDKTKENTILLNNNEDSLEDKELIIFGTETESLNCEKSKIYFTDDKIKTINSKKNSYTIENNVNSNHTEKTIKEVDNIKFSEQDKHLNFNNVKDTNDNILAHKKIVEVKENKPTNYVITVNNEKINKNENNTQVNSVPVNVKPNLEDEAIKIHDTTTEYIENMNSDLKNNKVKTVTVENGSGEIKILKSSSGVRKNRKGSTVLTENNIVKIIVQTQTANIVISANQGFDPKLSRYEGLEVAIKKLKEDVGHNLVEKKFDLLDTQFKDADSMKKLVNKVGETIKIIGAMNISNENSKEDKNIQLIEQKRNISVKPMKNCTDETNTDTVSMSNLDITKGGLGKNVHVLDVQQNDSQFLRKNFFNAENTPCTNSDDLKLEHVFDNDKINSTKTSEQSFSACKENSVSSSPKVAAKSLEQLNKEECTRYCFADYDYSYAKIRAKKQLDEKMCMLDSEDALCFKAYFSSIEKRLNKSQVRSPSIKFQRKKENRRKLGRNKTNFNCNRNYSTTSKIFQNRFKDDNNVKKIIKPLQKGTIQNVSSKVKFVNTLENKKRIATILSGKDGDKPVKPPDKKTTKEDDKSKKSDKTPKKTIFKIIRAPNIHSGGRRYTKSARLKSRTAKKYKNKNSKKSAKPTYHGRRNIILYLLQNQLNNKINKSNLKSERKAMNPKEEVEKTIGKFKVDLTHDNDTDFHTVSITDTELYKEKRWRENEHKHFRNKVPKVLNTNTKKGKTSVSDFNKKSTDPSGHNTKIISDKNVNESTDEITEYSTSKYLLENQASLYRKYSTELKENSSPLKERILNKQSVLKSIISQRSTSKYPSENSNGTKQFSKNVKSRNKTTNDTESEQNKNDDKKPPKSSLNDDASKTKTFREMLSKELANIFENGPPDYNKPDKLVAKVEEFVDKKNTKLEKFNKKLGSYTNLSSTSKNKTKPQNTKSKSFVNNKSTETNKSTHIPSSSSKLTQSKITIEKELRNVQSLPSHETSVTFSNAKKDCEIVRIPPKSLFQMICTVPNENETTLTKRNTEKIMSVQKSGFGRFPGVKITYVATNKGDSDTAPGDFSIPKTNLLKEEDKQSVITARYELLKKLQDEFTKLHSFDNDVEPIRLKTELNESENPTQDFRDAVSHGSEDTCLEEGSNQSLVDDTILPDFSPNSSSNHITKDKLETILKTWINRISTPHDIDKNDPKK